MRGASLTRNPHHVLRFTLMMMKKLILIYMLGMLLTGQIVHAQDKVLLRVGYVPLLTQLPLVVSYENDHLNFLHIKVDLIRYTSFTSLEAALRVGAIDAASIPVPIALSIAADVHECELCQITVIGNIHRGGSLLVAKSEGGIEAIRGELVGVPGLDSVENLLLKETLATTGLRFGMDYKTIGVPFETAIKYFKAGKLGALYLPEPFGTLAESEEIAVAVAEQQDQFTGVLTTVLVIHSEFVKSHTTAVREWLKSVITGCQFIENDIDTSGGKQIAIIQSPYFGYPKEIVATSLEHRKGGMSFRYGLPRVVELQDYLRLASEMKLIMKSVDWNLLISPDLMQQITEQ
jgi:ABC-type nitrate/sulfonate/bicarbonate transport system substrate-binding protein